MLFFSACSLFVTLLTLCSTKVYEIFHRDHFHDLIQDLPIGSRYSAVIAFYNDTTECNKQLDYLDFTSSNLPSVEHLLVGKYDFRTQKSRVWYEYADHLDLPEYLGINKYISNLDSCECPIIVYIPSTYCDGMGDDYLSDPPLNGIQIWKNQNEDEQKFSRFSHWKQWIWSLMKQKIDIVQPLPFDFQVTVNYQSNNYFHHSIENDKSIIVYDVDALQSVTEVYAYPGDTIYVSNDPQLNIQMKRERAEKRRKNGQKPTSNAMNPTYVIYSGLLSLHVIELDDGRWGFPWDRHSSITDNFVGRRHATTMMTHTRNLILPQVLPATHSVGFIKLSMPPGLHERLKKFYRRWYHNKAAEEWDSVGTQLNFFDVKSHMISLDHDFYERDSIANDVIGPMLLKWANENGGNIKSVAFTAFYGIREYSRNAVLRNHVDRVDTHVFSVILQIGQTDLSREWPLEVIGFDGVRYRITLKPGEMIFYEGHKLIHGRPEPFHGESFANCFVHFKPSDWAWTTGKVWASDIAKRTLNELHISLRDIYR